MAEKIKQVTHIEEVDPNHWYENKSSAVNDYLSLGGWILLNTGTHSQFLADEGPSSSVYYAVGWIGRGEPNIPQQGP